MKTHAKKMVSFLVFHFESGPWNPRKDVLCIHYPLSPSYLIHHINQFESSLETLVTRNKNKQFRNTSSSFMAMGCGRVFGLGT